MTPATSVRKACFVVRQLALWQDLTREQNPKPFPATCQCDRRFLLRRLLEHYGFGANWCHIAQPRTVAQSHSSIGIIFSPGRSQALCNLWLARLFFPGPLGPDITQTLLWFCGQSQLIVQTGVAKRDSFRPARLTHASLSSRIVRVCWAVIEISTQEKQLVLQFIRLVVMLYDINKLS